MIPNAGQRQLWSVEDVPAADLLPVERLLAYRRIRDTLMQTIRVQLLLPSRLAVLPQRK